MELDEAKRFLYCRDEPLTPWMPGAPNELERGGIIGSVDIVDCVRHSSSPWFAGPIGFVLRDPQPLTFTPYKGQLGFFDVRGVD